MALLALSVVLTACASEDDVKPLSEWERQQTAASHTSAPAPVFVETGECRDEAGRALDILDLGLKAGDMGVLFDKLRAVEELGSAPTAMCSGEVSVPVDEAVHALKCFRAEGLSLSPLFGCPTRGQELFVADGHIAAARAALEATA